MWTWIAVVAYIAGMIALGLYICKDLWWRRK